MLKKSFVLTLAIVLAGLLTFGMAAEEGSWKGWIADENCAKNYERAAAPGHVDCAKSCIGRGAAWAIATSDGHFLLEIEVATAELHLGHEVVIKGELDKEANTIKVASVAKAE